MASLASDRQHSVDSRSVQHVWVHPFDISGVELILAMIVLNDLESSDRNHVLPLETDCGAVAVLRPLCGTPGRERKVLEIVVVGLVTYVIDHAAGLASQGFLSAAVSFRDYPA